MTETKIHILRPFGPSIAKFDIPKDIIKTLNDHVDKIIIDEKKSKELDNGPNLAGNVTQEFKIEGKYVEKSGLLNLLANAIEKWIESTEGKKITKLNVNSSWVVRQFENEYNPTHYHGGHISGVCYLKLPKDYGKTFQPNKEKNYNGLLNFIEGRRSFNSRSKYTVEPKVGDFYIFPAYLMHSVYPFYGKGERRSLSFNALIDQDIVEI